MNRTRLRYNDVASVQITMRKNDGAIVVRTQQLSAWVCDVVWLGTLVTPFPRQPVVEILDGRPRARRRVAQAWQGSIFRWAVRKVAYVI